jgi:hypothetical protein
MAASGAFFGSPALSFVANVSAKDIFADSDQRISEYL